MADVELDPNGFRMRIAYLDCFAGASGDMILGAFLDVGLDIEALRKALKTLPLENYVLRVHREERNHLFGTRFIVDADKENLQARTFADIKSMIQDSGLSDPVKERSTRIFESLAAEEGRIHNCAPAAVHFHEVGAVDSIVDIVGAVFALESLGVDSLYASPLPLGSGFVQSRHGAIPLPAPATIALLKGTPVYDSGIKVELVTPTGAALLTGLACAFGPMPPMVVDSVGYGVGARRLADRPNLLRVLLGRVEQGTETDTVVVLEANVDDANPEWLGYLMERLFQEGALDVLFCPVQMKKNRPGVLIQVIGKPHHKDLLSEIFFRESTTLGVRFRYSQRSLVGRSWAEVDSPWGKMQVKKVRHPDGSFRLLPEYEACRKIAMEKQIPLTEIYSWVWAQDHEEA
jgi:pyridinium-3,5-bisthiocarboxylic acid mononucleotide nickel chelatase